jgi:hypothetical protein
MTNKMGLTLFTAGLLSAAVLFAPCTPSVAQERSATSTEFSAQQGKKDDKRKVVAPRRAQPRVVAPQRTAPRVVAPHRTAPRVVAPQRTAPRMVTQPKVTPRVVTPRGTRAVTASRLRGVPVRGAGRTVIRGQNYSAWRSGYRVRRGSGWRTFVGLGALGAIAIGSSQFYPYAYISAPEPYCEGQTEDGCELMWQEVETIEGDVVNQCVAYCPWQ